LEDVLALVHAESGAETRAADPLDLHVVARAAAADIRAVADGKKQTVALALEGPLAARGDAHALQQAVTNLLDLAVTYTPVGGTIRLVGRRARAGAPCSSSATRGRGSRQSTSPTCSSRSTGSTRPAATASDTWAWAWSALPASRGLTAV